MAAASPEDLKRVPLFAELDNRQPGHHHGRSAGADLPVQRDGRQAGCVLGQQRQAVPLAVGLAAAPEAKGLGDRLAVDTQLVGRLSGHGPQPTVDRRSRRRCGAGQLRCDVARSRR